MKRGLRPRSKLIDKHIKEEAMRRTNMRGVWDESTQSFIQDHKYCFEKFEPIIREHFDNGGGYQPVIIAGLCGTTHASVHYWTNPNHKLYRKEFHELIEECRTKAAAETDKWHRESANGGRPKANATTLNRRAEVFLDMVPVVKTYTKIEDIAEIDAQIDRIKELQTHYAEAGDPQRGEK